jgi:hypothetical protein
MRVADLEQWRKERELCLKSQASQGLALGLAADPRLVSISDTKNTSQNVNTASNNNRYTNSQQLRSLEKKITKKEEELSRLEQDLAQPEVFSDPAAVVEISQKIAAVKSQVDALYQSWIEQQE